MAPILAYAPAPGQGGIAQESRFDVWVLPHRGPRVGRPLPAKRSRLRLPAHHARAEPGGPTTPFGWIDEQAGAAPPRRTRTDPAPAPGRLAAARPGEQRLPGPGPPPRGHRARAAAAARRWGAGATGSRLVTGTTELHAELERGAGRVLRLRGRPGLLLRLRRQPRRRHRAAPPHGSLIVSDAGNHASLIDGCRLARGHVTVVAARRPEAVRKALDRARPGPAVAVVRLGLLGRRRRGPAGRARRRLPGARRGAGRGRRARAGRAGRRRARRAARRRARRRPGRRRHASPCPSRWAARAAPCWGPPGSSSTSSTPPGRSSSTPASPRPPAGAALAALRLLRRRAGARRPGACGRRGGCTPG